MTKREILAGNDDDGNPILFEVRGNEAHPLTATADLPRGLELGGILGEDELGEPSLDTIRWAVLPRPDGDGGVTGTLDVCAPVSTDWGPVWRPQCEVKVASNDGAWDIDVDDGLAEGYLVGGRIEWEGGGVDSHAAAVCKFLSQPLETARLAGAVKLIS